MCKPALNSIYNIVARKISGQASNRENQQFEEWINSSQKAKETFSDFQKIWKKKYFSEEDFKLVSQKEAGDKIWQSTFGKAENPKHKRFSSLIFIRLAAAFIVLLITAFALFYTINSTLGIVPQPSVIYKQTLPGQKSTITLRDGSLILLNSSSKISYSSDFNHSLRMLELEGQAFFEVVEDKAKPFIVKCRNLEVEALGTAFDINVYKDSSIQVSVLNGIVRLSMPGILEIKNLILYPGEFSVVDYENNFIDKGNFNPNEVLAWKDGRLIFKDATIEEIIPKLELWYGVKISNYFSINPQKPFTGTFEKENLDNILHNMGKVMDFNYEIKGSNVTIN